MLIPFLLLGAFVIVGLGLSIPYIIWPERMCFFGFRWLYDDPPEPSDLALFGTRLRGIVGVIATVVAASIVVGLITDEHQYDAQQAAAARVSEHLNSICPSVQQEIDKVATFRPDGTVTNLPALKKLLRGESSTILTEDQWWDRLDLQPPPPAYYAGKQIVIAETYTISYVPKGDSDLKTLGKSYVDYLKVSFGKHAAINFDSEATCGGLTAGDLTS